MSISNAGGTDADNELRLDYLFEDTASTHNFSAMVRFVNWDNLYYVKVQPGVISIVKRVAGGTDALHATVASVAGRRIHVGWNFQYMRLTVPPGSRNNVRK